MSDESDHHVAMVHHAFYCGELDAGRRAAEHVLGRAELPEDVEWQVRHNRTFYTQTLEDICPSARHVPIRVEPVYDDWSLFNPSVMMVGDTLWSLVRSSNYRIIDGRYVMPDGDRGVIRTEWLLVRHRHDLSIDTRRHVAGPDYPHSGYPVVGLEDCRLRIGENGVGVSATIRDCAPFTDGRCRVALADLDLERAQLANVMVLDGLGGQEHEKNWMPILHRGGWLYACTHGGHTVTVDANVDIPGGWQMARRHPAPPIARRFRGGSQLVPWRGGYLACVHEVVHHEVRVYEHRFVWFDADLTIREVSPVFAFRESRAIEFAAGLALVDDRVVVSYGVRDAEAWLVEVTEDDVAQCLSHVDRHGLRAA